MAQKKVSIVIPACNEEKYIVKCLQSLKAQTYSGPSEIIIVDNNSSDNTQRLAKEQGVIVLFEPTRGVCFARETGTKAATGEYIIQTDADSTFPPGWLKQIMDAFEANPKAVAVAGSFEFNDGPWWGDLFFGALFDLTDLIYKTTDRLIFIPGSNTAFRKDVWHGYNPNFDQGGDESALLKQLRSQGDLIFLRNNTILTSPRRMEKGLLYNVFVTFLYYRVFDYSRRQLIDAYQRYTKKKDEAPKTI